MMSFLTSAIEVTISSAFVCKLAKCKQCSTGFHKIPRKGGTWAAEETIGFSW